ncbi:SDR family oxidoreductase [Ahrensia sp. R2A130]|uniref:SDR family NAD(P)-dependent oxidoreductase n=1 Tax=Ahrensia sp. R2A130 TaxID=744979 RepID=UPI0001E0AC62|nr:SDR family NAD(P)-dependent oxidoreductase [Ahrensia sp. R2A130]EFL90679.1 putative short chain oxidoreductase [Ahrensia sp. R2A130]
MADKKRVLITGAAGGIGLALIEYLEDKGFYALVHVRDRARAEKLVGNYGRTAVWGDLTKPDEIQALAEQAIAAGPLDWIIHNAGILTTSTAKGGHGVGLHGEVNVIAPMVLTRALASHMAKTSSDPVVTVVSSSAANMARAHDYASLAEPDGSSLFGHYAVSKAAANAAVVRLAEEFSALRIYSTEPGFVKTDMTAGNSHMPSTLRWASKIIASTPERAARRCFAYLLENNPPTGSVIQKGKVFKDAKAVWRSAEGQGNLSALLKAAGLPS